MNNDPSKGERFSHVYLQRGEPSDDSVRMRHRLASLIQSTKDLELLGWEARKEIGVSVPAMGNLYDWERFLKAAELRDVLDLITVAWRLLAEKMRRRDCIDHRAGQKWIADVSRVFAEENVRYVVDERGGVHFAID